MRFFPLLSLLFIFSIVADAWNDGQSDWNDNFNTPYVYENKPLVPQAKPQNRQKHEPRETVEALMDSLLKELDDEFQQSDQNREKFRSEDSSADSSMEEMLDAIGDNSRRQLHEPPSPRR